MTVQIGEIREQNICPLCGDRCYDNGVNEQDKWQRTIICPKCHEFRTEYFEFTEEEKKLLSNYFASIPSNHKDRLKVITKDNYKEFIKRARKQK